MTHIQVELSHQVLQPEVDIAGATLYLARYEGCITIIAEAPPLHHLQTFEFQLLRPIHPQCFDIHRI